MNPGIPASGRPEESLEQLFGSVFDLAGQFAATISQDDIEARLRRTLRTAERPAPAPVAAPSSAAGQPVSALVSQAAAGDPEAWNQIVDRYAPLVHAICQRYRLTNHDAEDVAQLVWLLLVEWIGTLRDPAALPGWLATTTSRECLRVLGTVRRAGRSAMPPEDSAWLADDTTVDAEILAAERNAALHTAIRGLPFRCQQLLSMLVSDPPYSYVEISAALGIPVGSIGPQRDRCLNRLRRAMTPAPSRDEPGRP
jgi:RNA polymerase sigma factor (sigma-70 family)